MSEVLVDSSVWIAYLRQGEGAECELLDRLLVEERVVLCGVVELELLQGARPHERRELGGLLKVLHYVETDRHDFIAAGHRLAELRRRGVTIPATDGLVAALCLRHRLKLLAIDAHFDHISELTRAEP